MTSEFSQKLLSSGFTADQIREIYIGLKYGLDISLYFNSAFTWRKMREIRLGLEQGLDVSQYANPSYSYWQMREIRLGLKNNLDVSRYSNPAYTAREMNCLRHKCQMEAQEVFSEDEMFIHRMEHYNILISQDKMKAYIELTNFSDFLTVDSILESLHNLQIYRGIDTTTIQNLVLKAFKNQRVLIAEGTPPVKGADGWYEYLFQTNSDISLRKLTNGSVDFNNIEWFNIVKKGQPIAIYHKAHNGIDGYNVTGQILSAEHGIEKNALNGSGFELLPDQQTYVAAFDGRAELKNECLIVSKLLILDKVTSLLEPIDFDGSIYITGNVHSGAHIHASKDIRIDGCAETAVITCGGSILFKQSVFDSGGGHITASGDIVGKFFEGATLYAGGNIQALYYLHCNMYAKGFIKTLTSRGSIAGGKAYAEKGFYLHNLGNVIGIPTSLCMGVTDELKQNYRELIEKMQETSKELELLINIHTDYDKNYQPISENIIANYPNIEDAIYTKQLQMADLKKEKASMIEYMNTLDTAQAIIEFVLYDNVTFYISGLTRNSRYTEHVVVAKESNNIAITEK